MQLLPNICLNFGRVDVLLNNAGYAEVEVFEKSTDEEVRTQFVVNVFGVVYLTREIRPYI